MHHWACSVCLCETKYWPGGRVGITELMVSRFWCLCCFVSQLICWQCLRQLTVCNQQSFWTSCCWPTISFWWFQFTYSLFLCCFQMSVEITRPFRQFWLVCIYNPDVSECFEDFLEDFRWTLMQRQSRFWIIIWTIRTSRSTGFKIGLR